MERWTTLWENQRFCIYENKDADQLRGKREYNTSSSFIQNSKTLAIPSGCATWFVSVLVRIHIVGFLMLRLRCFSIVCHWIHVKECLHTAVLLFTHNMGFQVK